MGGNYQKDLYKQLMEVMAKVDSLESKQKQDHKEIQSLTSQATSLRRANAALREKVSSLKQENAALTEKCRKPGAQKGHKGSGLSKAAVEEKIRKGIYGHRMDEIGSPGRPYITRYRLTLM